MMIRQLPEIKKPYTKNICDGIIAGELGTSVTALLAFHSALNAMRS